MGGGGGISLARMRRWNCLDNPFVWFTDSIEYPTERHVRKWACSFQDLLNDVTGRFRFEEYCKSQFNLENVRFWQACRDLKSLPLTAVNGSVQLVYE